MVTTATESAPGLWVRRVGLGVPVRMRRRVATALRHREQRGPERGEAESETPMMVQEWAGGAPGLWARRVGPSKAVGSERLRRMARAAAIGDSARREVGRVTAIGGEARQIVRAGGAGGGVSVGVRRAGIASATGLSGRQRVRFGDPREEQRRRVEAVR